MLLANSETEKKNKFKIFRISGLLISHDFANAFASIFPVLLCDREKSCSDSLK